jgi:hypothetical protein
LVAGGKILAFGNPLSTIACPAKFQTLGESFVACPFFVPTAKSEDIAWMHSSRLPLGAGWNGHCDAPGHEGAIPNHVEIKDLCNMGYAASCTRLPKQREWDAVRFSVSRDQGSRLVLWYVCELGHRPAGHGTLEYEVLREQWITSHPEPRIQNMAACYLHSYLRRRASSLQAESTRALPAQATSTQAND